ncbi:MAG: hypothetical protein GOU98_03865 [Candidatus Altiarchaeota archaeon]|nr:hypothetical protein [Candidatus Altiarchaeota archaeon]
MQLAEILLFLPSILIFSIIASYTDMRSRKIKNTLIIRMLLVSFILNVFYFSKNQGLLFYLAFIIVSFLLALILWWFDFWKAGDVKFYFALSTFLHPKSTTLFLLPFLGFLAFSIIITVFEGILTKTIEFKLNFSWGLLLPVAAAPLISILGMNALVIVFSLYYVGSKLKIARKFMIYLAVFMFIVQPLNSIKALSASFLFFLASAFKFKGNLPSAPMISASFIYTLILSSL